jgi:hypothetical protein
LAKRERKGESTQQFGSEFTDCLLSEFLPEFDILVPNPAVLSLYLSLTTHFTRIIHTLYFLHTVWQEPCFPSGTIILCIGIFFWPPPCRNRSFKDTAAAAISSLLPTSCQTMILYPGLTLIQLARS